MKILCGLFGKTRQGFYKQLSIIENGLIEEEMILDAVKKIRTKAKTRRWGARKLQHLVNKELSSMNIHVGRDKLFDLLRENHMLVRTRRRKYFTTQSHHWLHKYDNLIQDKEISGPNQLWVSDITYVKGTNQTYFLYLITDAYSQKVVGWHLSEDLQAVSAVVALKMALKKKPKTLEHELIHHSDRGVQYCSEEYIRQLRKHRINVSMTCPSSPQENAIAERMNGILKEEWLYDLEFSTVAKGRSEVKKVVSIYNDYRPHESLGNRTPNEVHHLEVQRHESSRVIGKTYSHRKSVNIA